MPAAVGCSCCPAGVWVAGCPRNSPTWQHGWRCPCLCFPHGACPTDRNHVDVNGYLGLLFEKRGQDDAAMECYRAALVTGSAGVFHCCDRCNPLLHSNMQWDDVPCHAVSSMVCCPMLCCGHVVLRHGIVRCEKQCHHLSVMPWSIMPCRPMSYRGMPCHAWCAVKCHGPCHATSCHSMLYHLIPCETKVSRVMHGML